MGKWISEQFWTTYQETLRQEKSIGCLKQQFYDNLQRPKLEFHIFLRELAPEHGGVRGQKVLVNNHKWYE